MSTYLSAIALVAGKREHVKQLHRFILEAEVIVPSETFSCNSVATPTNQFALIHYQGGLTDYPPQLQNVLRLDKRLAELDICYLLDTQMEGYAPRTVCWHRDMKVKTSYRGGKAMTLFNTWCRGRGIIPESRRNYAREMIYGYPSGPSSADPAS